MRLLQKGLRNMLAYSLLLVLLSIPVSFIAIDYIMKNEIDELILVYRKQFNERLKEFEYLEDLETDLIVLDNIVYDIDLRASDSTAFREQLLTVYEADSVKNIIHPLRAHTSKIWIKHKPYLLTIRLSLINSNDLIVTLVTVQGVLAMLLALGLVLINRSLSRKIWNPFYKTLSKLKAYELDKHQKIDFDNTDIVEFNDLNTAVSQLTEKNRKVFLQQKEFIENVSHELQTPLAVLQSKIDMFIQSPDMTEDQARLIQEVTSSMHRFGKLTRNMLLLSKIDNEQFADEETFDLSALIHAQITNLQLMADAKNLTMQYNATAENIRSNKTLVEVIIANLLTNAIRYNVAQGQILVFNQHQEVSVVNTGPPLKFPPENLFERFARGSSQQGTGLGLAIVKRICDLYGYGLNYEYKGGMHYFIVTFRQAS